MVGSLTSSATDSVQRTTGQVPTHTQQQTATYSNTGHLYMPQNKYRQIYMSAQRTHNTHTKYTALS